MSRYTYYPETPRVPPVGWKPGVSPRTDQPGDSCPFLRAAPGFRVVPESEWPQWIESGINLSAFVVTVFNQGSVGSCASESCCGALKVVREMCGLPRIEFNPYGVYGRVNGGSDSGSSLTDNLAFVRDKGAFPESAWPRSKGWQPTPSSEAYAEAKKYRIDEYYEIANWAEFASAMLQGWVVYWGYSGHAIVGVDLLNDQQFLYLNSWGKWGQASKYNPIGYGFGVANRSSIMWSYGAFAFRSSIVEV